MQRSRKLVFVNRFYAPDFSATSQILTDVAEAMARDGETVYVFTSRMSYEGRDTYRKNEVLNDVHIRRVWTTRMGRASNLGRIIDYLSFHISITLHLSFFVSRNDILVAKTDPPMLSIPIGIVAKLKQAKMVNWLQDIFPEVALNLGVGSSRGPLATAMRTLRNRSLRRADMNIAIGKRMSETVQQLGVPASRVCVIENFVDDEAITRKENHSSELRRKWGFEDSDFLVGYSGNLGRAHDLDTILNAAELLKHTPQVKFIFIGGGHLRSRLVRELEARNLSNVHLKPYQPRSKLSESLALPNLHLASLQPTLEGYIMPSKFYGIAAAGRPLLMIGDEDGEIGRVLADMPFGKCIAIGEQEQIVDFILHLLEQPHKLDSMGLLAREFIENRASRSAAFARWFDLVQRLRS